MTVGAVADMGARMTPVRGMVAQFLGATGGVALATFFLRGAPGDGAVRYAVTAPGVYGAAVAFAAELAISFILMITVLLATNRERLARYTPHFVGSLYAVNITFETPLSGMSMNPARSFGPAVYGGYWHTLWIYFIAPTVGMLAAAGTFLRIRRGIAPYCAKLHTSARYVETLNELGITHRRTAYNHPEGNSYIEQAKRSIAGWIEEYNHDRQHRGLRGQNPARIPCPVLRPNLHFKHGPPCLVLEGAFQGRHRKCLASILIMDGVDRSRTRMELRSISTAATPSKFSETCNMRIMYRVFLWLFAGSQM